MNKPCLSFRGIGKMSYFCRMEIKKSSHVDLERRWGLRFTIGLVIVLVAAYIAFQWKTVEEVSADLPQMEDLSRLPSESELPPLDLPETVTDMLPAYSSHSDVRQTDVNRVEAVDSSVLFGLREDIREALQLATASSVLEGQEVFDLSIRAEPSSGVVQPDTLPCFPGGDAACMRFLSRHVRYPAAAVDEKVQGCVRVQFIVEADGKLSDFRVVESVSPVLDKEALRVVKLMPSWRPGRRDGKPARFLYVLPVDFRL